MHEVLTYLVAQLDGETRASICARADGLMRGVRYEKQIRSRCYNAAMEAGWTVKKIEILCNLNAFYQIVLGPLAAASRGNLRVGLIREVPIAYGTKVKLTDDTATCLRECHSRFTHITKKLNIGFWCLQSACAQDLLFVLGNQKPNNK